MDKNRFTVEDALSLVKIAHAGQRDRLGQPYFYHVRAVGDGLADFDVEIQIAGYLHDILEDTEVTEADLRGAGLTEKSISIIKQVSRNLHPGGCTYLEGVMLVAKHHDATLVKIADNAHNSLPERVRALSEATGQPPKSKYVLARRILYKAVPATQTRLILARVNPELLNELGRWQGEDACS